MGRGQMNKVGGWSRRDSLGRASLSRQNDQGHSSAKWNQLFHSNCSLTPEIWSSKFSSTCK